MRGIIIPGPEFGPVSIYGHTGAAYKLLTVDASGRIASLAGGDGVSDLQLLTDANGELLIRAGHDGSNWQRLKTDASGNLQAEVIELVGATALGNTLVGFNAKYHEKFQDTNAAAGAPTLQSSAVPSGEVWVLQALHASCGNRVVRVAAHIVDGANVVYFHDENTAGSFLYSTWTGAIYLTEGQYVKCYFITTVLNDDIYLGLHGYKFKI